MQIDMNKARSKQNQSGQYENISNQRLKFSGLKKVGAIFKGKEKKGKGGRNPQFFAGLQRKQHQDDPPCDCC